MKGSDPYVKCKDGEGERGKILYAWASVKLQYGDPVIEVMSYEGKDSLMSIKKRSPAVRLGKQTPWDTDEEEMCRKTVLKRALKTIPKGNKLAKALQLDAEVESGKKPAELTTFDELKMLELNNIVSQQNDSFRLQC